MIRFSEIIGNSQKLDGGAMFGNAPRVLWEKWAPPDEQGRIDLTCRALLVEIDNVRILFETGIGAFFEPKLAERFGVQTPERHKLLDNLNNLQLSPADIDWVVLSHLHFDHAGGLLPTYEEIQKGRDDLVFPKAQYIVGAEAFARAKQPHFRDRASFIPHLTDKLEATKRLHIVEGGEVSPIFPHHIQFIFSHGHTPGHMHSLITGNSGKLFFAGDLIPGIAWIHLPITMGYDRYAEKVIDEKQQIYQQAVPGNWNFFYTHDSVFACSKVKEVEKNKFSAYDKIEHPIRLEL